MGARQGLPTYRRGLGRGGVCSGADLRAGLGCRSGAAAGGMLNLPNLAGCAKLVTPISQEWVGSGGTPEARSARPLVQCQSWRDAWVSGFGRMPPAWSH